MLEVRCFFTGADKARGDAELVLNGDNTAAFSRAVELSHDNAVEVES